MYDFVCFYEFLCDFVVRATKESSESGGSSGGTSIGSAAMETMLASRDLRLKRCEEQIGILKGSLGAFSAVSDYFLAIFINMEMLMPVGR